MEFGQFNQFNSFPGGGANNGYLRRRDDYDSRKKSARNIMLIVYAVSVLLIAVVRIWPLVSQQNKNGAAEGYASSLIMNMILSGSQIVYKTYQLIYIVILVIALLLEFLALFLVFLQFKSLLRKGEMIEGSPIVKPLLGMKEINDMKKNNRTAFIARSILIVILFAFVVFLAADWIAGLISLAAGIVLFFLLKSKVPKNLIPAKAMH